MHRRHRGRREGWWLLCPSHLRVVEEIQLGLRASFCCPSSTRASAGRACVGPGPIQRDVAPFDIAGVFQALVERCGELRAKCLRRRRMQKSDDWRLLRARRERSRCCRAAERG
jgi:hypothetical protein